MHRVTSMAGSAAGAARKTSEERGRPRGDGGQRTGPTRGREGARGDGATFSSRGAAGPPPRLSRRSGGRGPTRGRRRTPTARRRTGPRARPSPRPCRTRPEARTKILDPLRRAQRRQGRGKPLHASHYRGAKDPGPGGATLLRASATARSAPAFAPAAAGRPAAGGGLRPARFRARGRAGPRKRKIWAKSLWFWNVTSRACGPLPRRIAPSVTLRAPGFRGLSPVERDRRRVDRRRGKRVLPVLGREQGSPVQRIEKGQVRPGARGSRRRSADRSAGRRARRARRGPGRSFFGGLRM